MATVPIDDARDVRLDDYRNVPDGELLRETIGNLSMHFDPRDDLQFAMSRRFPFEPSAVSRILPTLALPQQHDGCAPQPVRITLLPCLWVSKGPYPLAVVWLHQSQVRQMPPDVELGGQQSGRRNV